MRGQPVRVVDLEEAVEGGLPDAGGHLEALVDEHVEGRLRQRPGGRAGLELVHEFAVDRVLERRHGLPELRRGGVLTEGSEGGHQDGAEHVLRVVDGDLLGDPAAHRGPRDDRGPELQGVHQGDRVGSEVGQAVARGRTVGVAVAALRDGDGVDRVRQVGQRVLERAPGVGVAVQQQHRHAGGVALLDVRERHSGGERDGFGRAGHGCSFRSVCVCGQRRLRARAAHR